MKPIRLILAATAILALTACSSGPGEGKTLEETNPRTQADSLSYYFGAMYADNYWRTYANDSSATSSEARKQYLDGVGKGISLGEDRQYLEGVMTGIQFVLGIQDLEKDLGVKLDKNRILDALAYGLRNDSAVDGASNQQALQQILQAIGEKKDREDKKTGDEAVAKAAAKAGMKKMGDGIYGKVTKPGQGALLKAGDAVKALMTVTPVSGKTVNIPMPEVIQVGSMFRDTSLGPVIETLHANESVELMTSAIALFGNQCTRMGLDPTEVVKITLTTDGLAKSETPSDLVN